MSTFYDNNLNSISNEILLEATPFHKDTRINFFGKLTPEIFFKEFYVDSIDISEQSQDRNIMNFTKAFDDTLKEATDNPYAKVDMIHLEGYGGCGKTTFIRHLLWSKFNDRKLKYVIDFAGTQHIEKVYIFALSKLIYENFYISKALKLEEFNNMNLFETRCFGNVFSLILDFVQELLELEKKNIIKEENIKELFFDFKIKHQQEMKEGFISFLLRFYFIVQLLENILNSSKPIVIVLDNVDSIDNIEEERDFVSQLKKFIIDCNYFFGLNVDNNNILHGALISDIVKKFKMICFLTTRIVTFRKIVELYPDMEELYGWKSFRFPDNYFNHLAIIERKLDFYLSKQSDLSEKKFEELLQLKRFSQNIYKANIVNRIFNGNIRFSMKAICNIIKEYYNTGIINECGDLFAKKVSHKDNIDGAIGMVINLVFNYFKNNNIYDKKLHLSSCLPDYRLSLSRLILTVLREKKKVCSIIDLFDCLSPFFELKEICDVVYDLSEGKRDIWRRLLIFSKNYPENGVDGLYAQMESYKRNDRASEKYSTIELCEAGEAYLDIIIPHFEFMLSRHSEYDYSTNLNYHPLFSKSSLDRIGSDHSTFKYRFERKIDWVYTDVKDCCKNSEKLSKSIMEKFSWDEKSYLDLSVYNYRSKYNDGTFGYKQDYVARLIFGHIGYIERYRRYILQELTNNGDYDSVVDINKRLVNSIKKYLELYTNPESIEYKCCHSKRQDEAAIVLIKCIEEIESNNYKDIDSQIEVIK